MNIHNIPVVTVSYNAPELIRLLLASFRAHYPNPYYIIDGSDPEFAEAIKQVCQSFDNVHLTSCGYNIHHGPGLSWAINNLSLSGPVLFLDSDITILRPGALEALLADLRPEMYGVGGVAYVNREGFDIEYEAGAIAYLHPGCMLCNIEVMRQWPMPIKHGAPMVDAMRALHDAGKSDLLGNIDWVINDVKMGTRKIYIDHKGQGTVTQTGGYHLDDWAQKLREERQSRPDYGVDLDSYNHDLLALIPLEAKRVVEVGCNVGALAAAYKKLNPHCDYLGIEIDSNAAQLARQSCDAVLQLDIESVAAEFFNNFAEVDCWIFGDVLEHLRDPWVVLSRIRAVMPASGCIVACIPNAQHWSIQARLSIGDFRYQNGGLLDRTHLRWFTRATIFELFQSAKFKVVAGQPRIFNEPGRMAVLPAIRLMAQSIGADPDLAVNDSLAMQYVVVAKPE